MAADHFFYRPLHWSTTPVDTSVWLTTPQGLHLHNTKAEMHLKTTLHHIISSFISAVSSVDNRYAQPALLKRY
jgi:hypothetical protein